MKNKSFYTQLNKEQRYILNCCFFVFAVNGIYSMSLGSLLPLISAEYGLKDTVSGALLSAHQVGNLISGFIAGVLPLYLGRKKSIIFLCSFVVMGFSIMILTGNPILLILGFLFTGLSRGSISNFNNSVVNELSDSSPVALNVLHSIFAVGALLSPFLVILCTYISKDQGWKIAAGVMVFFCLISIFLFSKIKIENAEKKTKKVKISYEFLKNVDFLDQLWDIVFLFMCRSSY
jgi:MFS family permease